MGKEQRTIQGALPEARGDDAALSRAQRDEVGLRARGDAEQYHEVR